jgi:hypothetical protein
MEPALGRRLFLPAMFLAAVVSAAVSGAAGETRSYPAFVVVTAVVLVLATLAGDRRRGV